MLKLQCGCNQRRGNDSTPPNYGGNKQCLYCKVAMKFDGPVVTRQGDAEHALCTATAGYTQSCWPGTFSLITCWGKIGQKRILALAGTSIAVVAM
jgi:hypothetical protein